VAVVTGEANPLAMVQDPQTRGYLIHRGSKIGKQGGQVTQILRDAVTVTEYFQSPDGRRNPNAITLHLNSEQAVSPDLDFLTGKRNQ
jgi:type IV pilus assembly protein PilP